MYEYSKFWDRSTFERAEKQLFLDHGLEKHILFNLKKVKKYAFFAQKDWNFIFW